MDRTAAFEQERSRLLRVAGRILGDSHEAEDVVQNTWLRMQSAEGEIYNLQGWLTTATTRLCLDRLRGRMLVVDGGIERGTSTPDASDQVALAETVGVALQLLLDRLTPNERVAFVLHESFGFDFPTIAEILGRTPAATRKLASRARTKLDQPRDRPTSSEPSPDWQVVDAFLAAAREGDFTRLLALLAPTVIVEGDPAAIALGTPQRIEGAEQVARFFDGAAKTAFPVFVSDRPGAAWILRGEPKVVFDFTIEQGKVLRIDFRAEAGVLAQVRRRDRGGPGLAGR